MRNTKGCDYKKNSKLKLYFDQSEKDEGKFSDYQFLSLYKRFPIKT